MLTACLNTMYAVSGSPGGQNLATAGPEAAWQLVQSCDCQSCAQCRHMQQQGQGSAVQQGMGRETKV